MPKRSGTKATRRVVFLRETRASRTCGTERENKVAVMVPKLASVGMSSRGMKGRETQDILGWRVARKLDCVGVEKFVKVKKVAEKPWWHTSCVASSTKGIIWPIPGLERNAILGNSVTKVSFSIVDFLVMIYFSSS